MLLLPDTAEAIEISAGLVVGTIPESWPASLDFMRLALQQHVDEAVDAIGTETIIERYNRAVLGGGDGAWEALAEEAQGELRALVDTARFSVGLIDVPPSVEGATGEVAAVVRSARASAAMERGDFVTAVEELGLAAQAADDALSPILATSLHLTRAELLREQLDNPAAAAREADLAIQRLPLTAPSELRAELQVTRALARQQLAGTDRGALLAVVADLTESTRVFREDTYPEMFATVNQHLALAYLVMPMSDNGDRIRVGVAVNSLRAALRIFTAETHPVAWASTQLNLANALQYLPSAHQESNLDEAVQLYEELLQHRNFEHEPLGYARILSNQGNALGHLGVFADARQRLERARTMFESQGDGDSVASVDEILVSLCQAETAAVGGGL